MMPTTRTTTLALLALASAACSSNTPPDSAARPRANGRQATLDSIRANKVIENARPDAPARAGMIVVANQGAASATVVDAASMQAIATLPVGVGPHEVAVSPDGRWAVVTNYGTREVVGNTISVIDLAAPTPVVARTINLGDYKRPHGAAFINDGRTLAVTSEVSQRLVLVDFASGKVDTALATNGRGSHMVAVRRDGKRAWTANIGDGNITEFDLEARRTVRQLPAAANDEGIATTPGGILVWVGSNSTKTVTIIDTERGQTIATLDGFSFPYRIGINRTGSIAIVNDPMANKVLMYDVGNHRQIASIDLSKVDGVKPAVAGAESGPNSAGPEGITFDPIAEIAYITLNGSNQVIALDLHQKKVVGFGPVGTAPDGIAYSPMVRH